MKPKLFIASNIILAIFLTLGLSISFQSLMAANWSNPVATPPNNNIGGLINAGAMAQTKTGDLTISGNLTGGTLSSNLLVIGSTLGIGATIMGNVGIGTVNPNRQLHIFGTSGNNAELDIQSKNGANNHWAIYNDRAGNDLRVWGGNDWLTILNNGNVGIGTNNPGSKMVVNGNLGATQYCDQNGGNCKAITAMGGGSSMPLLADTGTANNYVLTPNPAVSAYNTTDTYIFKAANANSAASTANISGLGAKTIKVADGSDVTSGQIRANGTYMIKYDGTNMIIFNPSNYVQSNSTFLTYATPQNYIFEQGKDCPESVTSILVEVWGGGGGGGSGWCGLDPGSDNGGGGGGGGYAIKRISLSSHQLVGFTVGAGGRGTSLGLAGSNGENTSFGAYITANGGGGGNKPAPGAGGTATGGDVNMTGYNGTSGSNQCGLGGAGAKGGAGGNCSTAPIAPGGAGAGSYNNGHPNDCGSGAIAGQNGTNGMVKISW